MTDVKLPEPAATIGPCMFGGEPKVAVPVFTADQLTAAVMAERERCARVCEAIAPSGGRAWTESQHAAAVALGIAANAIRQPPAEDGE